MDSFKVFFFQGKYLMFFKDYKNQGFLKKDIFMESRFFQIFLKVDSPWEFLKKIFSKNLDFFPKYFQGLSMSRISEKIVIFQEQNKIKYFSRIARNQGLSELLYFLGIPFFRVVYFRWKKWSLKNKQKC